MDIAAAVAAAAAAAVPVGKMIVRPQCAAEGSKVEGVHAMSTIALAACTAVPCAARSKLGNL